MPDTSTGEDYAPWDTLDNPRDGASVPIITGGVFGNGSDTGMDRQGLLHEILDGDSRIGQTGFNPDAVIIETSAVAESVSINNDSADLFIDCDGDAAPTQFLEDVSIDIGGNTNFTSLSTTIAGDAGLSVSFDGSLVADSAESVLNHTISGNEITIVPAPGSSPSDAEVNEYLNGFVIEEASAGSVPADTTATGTITIQTTDVFGAGVVFDDTGSYSISIDVDTECNDLPDATLDNPNSVVVEESGEVAPFESFGIDDPDSNAGAVIIEFDAGWVQGDRAIDTSSIDPSITVSHDATDGSITIIGNGASNDQLETAVQSITISVADNQPDLTQMTGTITVIDSVNLEDEPLTGDELLNSDQRDSVGFTIDVVDRIEVSAGAPGGGIATGHDDIPDQIMTELFQSQFGETDLNDAQAVYSENGEAVNPFDDAQFESRDGEVTIVELHVQDGWTSESQWNIDDQSLADVGVVASVDGNGNIAFEPTNGDSFDAEQFEDALQNGAVTFEATGENVQTSQISFTLTGQDTNGLDETSLDILNNVDADQNGIYKVIQLGVNDAPTIDSPSGDPTDPDQPCVVHVTEGSDEIARPFVDLEITDVDSADQQGISFELSSTDGIEFDLSTFSAEAQSLVEQFGLDFSVNGAVISITGDAPTGVYQSILQGFGLRALQDDSDNRGTTEIRITVSLIDRSETGFGDHLTDVAYGCVVLENVDEPVPETKVPDTPVMEPPTLVSPPVEPPRLSDRHHHQEDDILIRGYVQEFEDIDTNVHIHHLVNGRTDHLDAQTTNLSGQHITELTSGILEMVEEIGRTPTNLLSEITSLDHFTEHNFLSGLQSSTYGTAVIVDKPQS